MLDVLQKHKLFTNLKKFQFYKNEIRFLGYVISAYKVKIEIKQIKVINN